MTLFVNLYGGPSTGKSTGASYIFSKLKMQGYNCELVTEYAKDLVWTNANETRLKNQYLIFGEQFERMRRVSNKVDVVITDSPLLLSYIYGQHLGDHWKGVVLNAINSLGDNLNIILERNHPYNTHGRCHTEEEALKVDNTIRELLSTEEFFSVDGYESGFIKAEGIIKDYLRDIKHVNETNN